MITLQEHIIVANPFHDDSLGVHWSNNELYDDNYKVGRVTRTLAGDQLGWMADPYWNEEMQFFATEEEAKSWLLIIYRMEGGAYVNEYEFTQHRRKGRGRTT